MLKVPLQQIEGFFRAAADVTRLYLPVDGEGEARFELWSEGKEPSRALNTTCSLKEFFFLQTETLYKMERSGRAIEVIDERQEGDEFALFGARACDVQALSLLDRVFLKEPADTYFKGRRERGVVISVACAAPEPTCFCTSLGIDASKPEGDASCIVCNSFLYIEPITEKGARFFEGVAQSFSALCECTDADLLEVAAAREKAKKALADAAPQFPKADELAALDSKSLFSSSVWEQLSFSCAGCGACTFLCPTCHCYDIRDFDCGQSSGRAVERFRCWDSCMCADFTQMSAGQPRPTKLERFRQRFMHKLKYFPENNDGILACVGCGRCIVKCPASMHIVKVARALVAQGSSKGEAGNEQ